MLEVLEQAQAAGQKIQQDALIGQGSIFDLQDEAAGGAGGAGATPRPRRPVHPPIPAEEFEQPELLAAEKEAIGLFVSAHPLKPLREALRARVDCPLSALADRRDKDWVTVGGIITEAKRIRTRNGDHMMFATLDDLAGAVEMLVFGKALAEHEAALAVDEVVLVKGRVDHKEAGKTCLVVQSVEPFAPIAGGDRARASAEAAAAAARSALAQPVHLRGRAPPTSRASAIEDLKQAIEDFPGPAEVRGRDRHERGHAPAAPRRGLPRAAHADAARRARARARAGRRSRRDRLSAAARGQPRAASAAGARDAALAQRAPRARLPRARRRRGSRRASRARTAAAASAGAERNAAQPSLAELALADVGVAVAVGAERRLRVVEVQRADAARAELARRPRAAPSPCRRRVRMS